MTKSVVFTKQFGIYFPGDNAGFEEATANELIKRGVAIEESEGVVETLVNFPEPDKEEVAVISPVVPEPDKEEVATGKPKGK